jgi:ATP/ADP translocase
MSVILAPVLISFFFRQKTIVFLSFYHLLDLCLLLILQDVYISICTYMSKTTNRNKSNHQIFPVEILRERKKRKEQSSDQSIK